MPREMGAAGGRAVWSRTEGLQIITIAVVRRRARLVAPFATIGYEPARLGALKSEFFEVQFHSSTVELQRCVWGLPDYAMSVLLDTPAKGGPVATKLLQIIIIS